jgi:hypothetical protein
LAKKSKELEEKSKLVKEKIKELESKSSEVVALQLQITECRKFVLSWCIKNYTQL